MSERCVSRILRGFCLFAVVLWCGRSAAEPPSQTTYEFKQNYSEGREYNVLLSEMLDMKYDLVAHGRTVKHYELNVSTQNKGKVTIVKTRGGMPVAERIAFDDSCGTATRQNYDEPAVQHSRPAGKTLTVRRDDDGKIQCDFEGADDRKLAQLLRGWLDRDSDLYPDHPVRIGDKWDVTKKLKDRLTVVGEHEQFLFTCTLQKVKEVKGHNLAQLSVCLASMDKLKGGIYVETAANGTAMVDLVTGRVCRADVTGTVHCCGSHDVGNATISASGDGTIEIHQISVPVSPGAAKTPRTDPAGNPSRLASDYN